MTGTSEYLDQTAWIPQHLHRQSDVSMHHAQTPVSNNTFCSLLYLIFGLQCLKNWRNLGIIKLRGLFRASLSNSSDESSQIFCSAPNEPWDTDIHREAVKSKRKHTRTQRRERDGIRRSNWRKTNDYTVTFKSTNGSIFYFLQSKQVWQHFHVF